MQLMTTIVSLQDSGYLVEPIQLSLLRSSTCKIAQQEHAQTQVHHTGFSHQLHNQWKLSCQSCLYTFRRGDCLLFRHGAFTSNKTNRTTTAPAPHTPADALSRANEG